MYCLAKLMCSSLTNRSANGEAKRLPRGLAKQWGTGLGWRTATVHPVDQDLSTRTSGASAVVGWHPAVLIEHHSAELLAKLLRNHRGTGMLGRGEGMPRGLSSDCGFPAVPVKRSGSPSRYGPRPVLVAASTGQGPNDMSVTCSTAFVAGHGGSSRDARA